MYVSIWSLISQGLLQHAKYGMREKTWPVINQLVGISSKRCKAGAVIYGIRFLASTSDVQRLCAMIVNGTTFHVLNEP